MVRSFMIHTALNWRQNGSTDLKLWYVALDHATGLYKKISQMRSGITPLQMVANDEADHVDLARTHV